MFTAEGGHGTEFVEHLPAAIKDNVKAQLVRTPKTPEEARKQVRELKARGVDGVKAILEAGWGEGMLYDRLDLLLVRAVSEEAHAQHLPLATHTGDARDVADAVEIGSASVEHGSWRDEIPDRLLERMAADGVYLDPTLGVAEAYADYFDGKADVLNHSLVQQVVPARAAQGHARVRRFRQGHRSGQGGAVPARADTARANLLRAWKAGVPLVMGTRFRQSDGLPRTLAAPRIAALGGGRNPGDSGPAGSHGQRRETAGRGRRASAPSARAWMPTCCWWTAIRFRKSPPPSGSRWWCSRANGFAGRHCSIRNNC